MKKLYRNSNDKWIAGICGGLSRTFEIDPLIIRLGLFGLTIATGGLPLAATYLLGWLVIPDESGNAMIGGGSPGPDQESTSVDEP